MKNDSHGVGWRVSQGNLAPFAPEPNQSDESPRPPANCELNTLERCASTQLGVADPVDVFHEPQLQVASYLS